MTLTEFIVEMPHLDDEVIEKILEDDLCRVAIYFIDNLVEDHKVPLRVIEMFRGINDFYNDRKFISDKQYNYLLDNLMEYNHYLDLMK